VRPLPPGSTGFTIAPMSNPTVTAFFDEKSCAASYVAADPATGRCAVIDPVLDFDPASGRTGHDLADRIVGFIQAEGLHAAWLLETHLHADHLSAAAYLKNALGGRLGIGAGILEVRAAFTPLFGDPGRHGFDRLFRDGERFRVGGMRARVLHTPGHTPACVTYVMGDAAFVGDTLFMPDYGTARCDFPGGCARRLYRSIRRILELPPATRLFLCHDYKASGRDVFCWETTVAAERSGNIHIHDGVDEDTFVALRTERDRSLPVPRLLIPAVQVNLRAGALPEPDANGIRYLRLPIDAL